MIKGQDYSYIKKGKLLIIQTQFEKEDFTREEVARILEDTALVLNRLGRMEIESMRMFKIGKVC